MQTLKNIKIADPRAYRLVLRIRDTALDVMLYSPIEDNSLVFDSITLAPLPTPRLQALQDAVYDHPVLLSDFSRVSIIIPAEAFLAVPTEGAADSDDCRRLIRTAFPSVSEHDPVFADPTGTAEATLLFSIPADLHAFLTRTYLNPGIHHSLSVLARYFLGAAPRSNSPRALLDLGADSVNIIIADRNRLLLANTFRSSVAADSLYYVMAALQTLGLPADTPVHVGGHAPYKAELLEKARTLLPAAVPLIFPSAMFKAGRDAMKAPLDLAISPLCE